MFKIIISILGLSLFVFYTFPLTKYFQISAVSTQGFLITLLLLGGFLQESLPSFSSWNGSIELSAVSIMAQIGLLILSLTILCIGLSDWKINPLNLVIVFCAVSLGGMVVIVAQDFALTVTQLELQSYATYLVIAGKSKFFSHQHGFLSYFLISGLATAGLITGWAVTLLDGGFFPSTNQTSWGLSQLILSVSFALKLGLYPFHAWVPLTYNETDLLALISVAVIPQLAILSLLNETIILTAPVAITAAGASILIGSLCSAVTVKPHGFLALSGISQLGFTLLALNLTFSGLVIFNFFYGLSLVAFAGVIWAFNLFDTQLAHWRGVINIHMPLALLGVLLLMGLGGVPPAVGFYTKAGLISYIEAQGISYLGTLLIIASLPSAIGYLRLALANLGLGWENGTQGNAHISLPLHKEILVVAGTAVLGIVGLNYGGYILLTRRC